MTSENTIPTDTDSVHFNFPEFFINRNVERYLIKLQKELSHSRDNSHIVLNLEKCHWFDIFPLARLLTILCSSRDRKTTIHVVGPCVDQLPYFHDYVVGLKNKLALPNLSDEHRQKFEDQITRYTETLPKLRGMAGAFLVGWGAFDLLEDYYGNCVWYASREKRVTLTELRDVYQFGYGASSAAVTAQTSDRVWPFQIFYPDDQQELVERINSEELIAGALRKYAASDVIADGTASNVFFFEPFENVYTHAFPNDVEVQKLGLMAMRVNDWMYSTQGELLPPGRSLLKRLPEWERKYVESMKGQPFMEITVCDCGVGIPATIGPNMLIDQSYLALRNLSIDTPPSGALAAWEAIKYAFEPHSTKRLTSPPGDRGLAWLREKVAASHGMIQVVSNGGDYVLADYGNGLTELAPRETIGNVAPVDADFVSGTFIRILFPLSRKLVTTPERRPVWGRRRLDPFLFVDSQSIAMQPFRVPPSLVKEPDLDEWHSFFAGVSDAVGGDPNGFAILDFARQDITRWSLEHMFDSFMLQGKLHGRTVIINCTRHVACRLDTILSAIQLQDAYVVIPLFETNLRLYWVGAAPGIEEELLRWFQQGPREASDELSIIAERNPHYFVIVNGVPRELRFGIEEIEEIVRRSLGRALHESLEQRGALYHGRFIMPLSGKTVTTYVEPHQLFVDSDLADLLCSHMAVLLRWRYGRRPNRSAGGRGIGRKSPGLRVLTATRIGRDIAIHMPEAYPQKYFVYFDYHLVQPSKPRLIKYLAGNSVVIVVDIISTGSQVQELIKICEDAGCKVLGVISFLDFSPEATGETFSFMLSDGSMVEHKTFLRLPQVVSEPRLGDRAVNKETFSISPAVEFEAEATGMGIAQLSKGKGLRLLEDAQATHYGHYELFGRHLDFATNFGRLITAYSPQRDEIIRATENLIINGHQPGAPTAIVLYPDFSNIHILEGVLMRRPKIRAITKEKRRLLRFVEARRGTRARGSRYWLTQDEINELKRWAAETHGGKFSVLLLDDIASSGETLLALLDLARELEPTGVSSFVLINRMPHLHTHHHRQIERFAWASSSFRCLLHLNAPTFTRENCPLCRERAELLRELRHAQGDWFKKQIERRLEELELTTALHPQDMPEGRYATPLENSAPFPWEDAQMLPGNQQTVISRALSVRTAINDGVEIDNVLQAVLNQPNDDLWRLTAIDIGRRVDLHMAQHIETMVRDSFIRVIRGRNMSRRIAALEALRHMRPEAILPVMRYIVDAALNFLQGDEIIAELLLLMRRVFLYRHLATAQAFEEEQVVIQELDKAAARAQPESGVRNAIDLINFEWSGGQQPQLNLLINIREMEKIFLTKSRNIHRLLYELDEYISDKEDDGEHPKVIGSLDHAVRATSLGKSLATILNKIGQLSNEELPEMAGRAYVESRELRRWVQAHIHRSERRKTVELQSKLEELKKLCEPIQAELEAQLVDPSQYFSGDPHALIPQEFSASVEFDVEINDQLPNGTFIIINRALFGRIANNLYSNLRHAIDPATKKVSATFTLLQKSEPFGPQVSIRVRCRTRGPAPAPASPKKTRTEILRQQAEPYGVEFSKVSDDEIPWDETWSFWRLEP